MTRLPPSGGDQPLLPGCETKRTFLCTDRRLKFIEVECFPVPVKDDRDGIVLAIRNTEDRLDIGAGLTRKDARALANYINQALA